MATSQYYVDPAIAGNSGTGTIGDPFGDLQYALNTITRNATDGDQINIKAGTAEILAVSLTLAVYGTPTSTGPLILRGYTAAANDGGVGEINCGGFTMWAATNNCVFLIDLLLHNFGNNNGVVLGSYGLVFHCTIHKGESAPNAKYLVVTGSAGTHVVGCYLHDPGADASRCISSGGYGYIAGNYVVMDALSTGNGITTGGFSYIISNVVSCAVAGQRAIWGSSVACSIINNVCCNAAAGTTSAIQVNTNTPVLNNIVVGWSGVGGIGIGAANIQMVGYNAFYNNTANYSVTDQTFISLTANDVLLGASPFTNAAAGDFSLTAAAQAALRDVGWPAAYLGAHANTDGHITIGPIQYGPTPAASGVLRRVATILGA